MADNILRRFLRVIFDRDAAKKAEREVQSSLETAGKKGGQGFVKELRAQYDKAIADLRVKLAKGLIDQKQFKQQATLAAKNFNAGIIKGMEDARKAGTLTDKEYLKLSRTLKRTGDEGAFSGKRISGAFLKAGAAIAAAFTVDRAIRFLKDSITAAIEAEKSVNRLAAALEPLGISYQNVSRQVEGYFDRIQKTTRFTDEDAREAFASLVTSTGDYNKSLKLLDLTANIAEKRNISMAEASKVTAKAALGLSRGMEDLGVTTGTTGDIVGILSRNLDGLAVSAGETTAGKIARMNNLWDEFKEKIGLAIIGSEGFQDSGRGMIAVLSDMNDWVEKNSDAITGLTSGVFRLLGNLLKLGVWLNEHLPSLVTLSKLIDKIRGTGKEGPLVAPTIEIGGPTATRGRTKTKEELAAEKEAAARRLAEARKGEQEIARERERIAHEIRVRTLMVEEQLTRELAEEMVRRQEILKTAAAVQFGSLEEGYKKLDQLNLLLRAGFDDDVTPSVQRTEKAMHEFTATTLNAGQVLADTAATQAELADRFSTPWIDAMGTIQNEVEGQGTLFAELGQAWAEGGFKGLVALAKGKVKENIARVIEELAKAFGSFALGNPAAATLHLKAAAQHGLAAAAWKGVAGVGGGGGGGAAGGAGAGGSGPVRGGGAASIAPSQQEINIYLTGPGFDALNPQVQKVVWGAQQLARERHGDNAKIRIRRWP